MIIANMIGIGINPPGGQQITSYYVRPAGTVVSESDGLSYDTAWVGFSNVNWALVENNRLYIAGTHNETLDVGASNFTLESYESDPGIIDMLSATMFGCNIISRSNVVLRGVTFNNATDACLLIQDSIVTTFDCSINGSGDQGIQHYGNSVVVHNNLTGTTCADEVISGHDSSIITINGGSFTDNSAAINCVQNSRLTVDGDVTYLNNTNDVLINGGLSEGSVQATFNNQAFTSNVIANTGGYLTVNNCIVPVLRSQFTTYKSIVNANNSVISTFSVQNGSDIIFDSCLIKTSASITGYCEINKSRVNAVTIDLSSGTGKVKARHSLFYHTTAGLPVRFRSGSECDINYCIFYGATGSANYLLRIDLGTIVTSLNNNVFISQSKQNGGMNVFLNLTLKNNIFYNLTSAIVPNTGITVESDYNCYFLNNNDSAGSGTVNETNKVAGDPMFGDVANLDFSLGEGSACIGSGLELTDSLGIQAATWGDGVNTHPEVTTVEQGGSWNIGAFIN